MSYKKVVITKYGGPDVLRVVEEHELPKPQKGEVRIKTLTTSACFTDTMIRKGIYYGVKQKPPFSPGYDIVGVVDELGEGVTHLKVGQRVAELTVTGAYSEYLCIPAAHCVSCGKAASAPAFASRPIRLTSVRFQSRSTESGRPPKLSPQRHFSGFFLPNGPRNSA